MMHRWWFPDISGIDALLNSESGCVEATKMGYISPKLYELMQVFLSFRWSDIFVTWPVHFQLCAFTLTWHTSVSNSVSDNVRCLIFVDRKISARVIERTMKKIGRLSCFRVSFLTGGCSSVDALTPKMQKDTLDSFRSGKVLNICHLCKLKHSAQLLMIWRCFLSPWKIKCRSTYCLLQMLQKRVYIFQTARV